MSELPKLGLLVAAFGGLSLAALAILGVGLWAARRRGAIVACAAAAGVLALLQGAVLAFLSSQGRAWGGGPAVDPAAAIGALVTLLALAAVAVFAAYKLPRAAAPGTVSTDHRRAAAWLIGTAVAVDLVSIASNRSGLTASLLLANPRFWLVIVGGLVAVWGLWRRERWAVWLAAVVCAWEVLQFGRWLFVYPGGPVMAWLTWSALKALLLALALAKLVLEARRSSA